MFRLTICCLVLGAALAKPAEKASDKSANHASKSEMLHSRKTVIEVGESRGLSDDPQPLPKPTTNSTDLRGIDYFLLHPGQYYFTSTNYPNNYPNYDYFCYVFEAASGNPMEICCNPFDVEPHPNCDYDWLQLNGDKFCGSGTFYYYGSYIVAEFSSDGSTTYPGFYCTITV
ncbi:Adhesion G-protein coupled receptor G6 [Amphibalanus amphitrite]|uniref:Adhesion G-protein coupled receptor G6 n=1 Tax=Amphibalanus amphitrite TaxID=1232801 RepID=A0A6A4VES0_AMPAM|nr:deleted in malignant brain tumors 1 protein-like [Amphibalanus amphitrite]KAF0288922.1 Adhesion G-protein coupled receptor G6 [Amphibalanus amphitrite]